MHLQKINNIFQSCQSEPWKVTFLQPGSLYIGSVMFLSVLSYMFCQFPHFHKVPMELLQFVAAVFLWEPCYVFCLIYPQEVLTFKVLVTVELLFFYAFTKKFPERMLRLTIRFLLPSNDKTLVEPPAVHQQNTVKLQWHCNYFQSKTMQKLHNVFAESYVEASKFEFKINSVRCKIVGYLVKTSLVKSKHPCCVVSTCDWCSFVVHTYFLFYYFTVLSNTPAVRKQMI